jgi:MFS family permease
MEAARATGQQKKTIPRQAMYGMLALQQGFNYVTRGSLAPLIQYIVADLQMSLAQKALLLGAFFPVFTPFQVVAGPLCQLVGGKLLLSLNLGGMSALLLLLPSMARVKGSWAMCACLAGIGVCQGVLVPAQGQLKRNWLPDGPERVWGLRIIGLGMRVGYPLAAWLVPKVAERFGWRMVPYLLGLPMAVFATVWHSFAAEGPAVAAEATAARENKADKSMEWSIFRVPAVCAAVSTHFAANNIGYCFLQWTPTYYNTVLKVSDVAAGAYIAFPGTIGIWLPFIIGAWQLR